VEIMRHSGRKGKIDTLRATYTLDRVQPSTVSEWICIEHEGWARSKAVIWWKQHSIADCPLDIEEAVELWHRHALRAPVRITIQQDGRWWRVIDREFDEEPPATWQEYADIITSDPFSSDDDELPF